MPLRTLLIYWDQDDDHNNDPPDHFNPPNQVTAENRLGSETHSLELVVHGEYVLMIITIMMTLMIIIIIIIINDHDGNNDDNPE